MNKPFEGAWLEMTLTPVMEKELIEFLNLEIEVLQGVKKKLPDGRTEFKVFIADEGKALLAKEFVLKMISQSHKANLS